MAENMRPGEDKAWDIPTTLKPDEVCKSAAVSYRGVIRELRCTFTGNGIRCRAQGQDHHEQGGGERPGAQEARLLF